MENCIVYAHQAAAYQVIETAQSHAYYRQDAASLSMLLLPSLSKIPYDISSRDSDKAITEISEWSAKLSECFGKIRVMILREKV